MHNLLLLAGWNERIRRAAGIPTTVGLITEPVRAEFYLADGRCDLVALAREMMWNPNWPVDAAEALRGPDRSICFQTYAWWLRRREEVRRLYRTGKETG
jgi:2,4-dienoyl-CoA reductase-like NADH-dependent reductase (Old Yellow Enzyme family)